ncbi:MAG: xylulokinase [Pyrinomonadaceae bacterium]|nr:xylulokinase [Pyrinomonadaceae bacterium]
MYLLGIDVGTGGSRAVLVTKEGEVAGTAIEDHVPFDSPEIGWAEQDPLDWWRATAKAVRKVLSDFNGEIEVGAVGFSGQMHGLVILDQNDDVIRPSLIWCDQRTQKQCDEITETFGKEKLIELVSNPALTNFTLAKLLWVRDNEPDAYSRISSVMLPKDYVRFRLTGKKATEVSDASGTLILDVSRRRWSKEILSGLDISAEILPDVFESQELCGTVTDAAARETGLKSGTPVVAGAGDNAAGAIGMGIVRPGQTSMTIGTSGVAFSVTERPKIDRKGRIHTFCHAVPERWHVTGVTQAAGLSFRWFRENFAIGHSFDELVSEAEDVPAGADGLLWTPYLMGERTPHIDPETRASLIGLTASHTRGHVVRAILEGVAFSLRDCLEVFLESDLEIGKVRLGGGGAKSSLWRRIQADVYGRTVETITAEEGAAFGAALLAGVGAGVWKSVDEACESAIEIAEELETDEEVGSLLESRYSAYRKIYRAVKPVLAID